MFTIAATEVMQQIRDEEMAAARELLKAYGHTATDHKVRTHMRLSLSLRFHPGLQPWAR